MPEYAPTLQVSYYAQNYAGIIRQGLQVSMEKCSLVPRPSNARALPLPLNYRNVEMKNAWEGSGKQLCPEVS